MKRNEFNNRVIDMMMIIDATNGDPERKRRILAALSNQLRLESPRPSGWRRLLFWRR